MKKVIFTLLLSLSISALFASQKEYKREIAKEFKVEAGSRLAIENKYGNIRVIEGTENKIMFKIEIIGQGSTEALAKEYAESVSVEFIHQGNRVSAKTILGSLQCSNCGRTINYVVVAPKDVAMNLDNMYGNIALDNVIEPLVVDLKYGNIQANSLATASIDLKYGKAKIGSGEALKIDSKYSGLDLGQVGMLTMDSKYDNIQIGSVVDFRLDTQYTGVKIGRLDNSLVAEDFKYGELDISDVWPAFSKIKVDAAYTDVKVALNEKHSFKVKLSTKFGHIKTGKLTFSDVSFKKEDAIAGRAGSNSQTTAEVDISVSYGNITFY
jgi:hypothetical protein